MPFSVEETSIPEVRIIRPRLFGDERGWFAEVLQADAFAGARAARVLRPGQPVALRARRGARPALPVGPAAGQAHARRAAVARSWSRWTSGRVRRRWARSVTLEASADEPVLFWAPASFARGFCALEDGTEIEYFCTAAYDPEPRVRDPLGRPGAGHRVAGRRPAPVGQGRRRRHARGLARQARNRRPSATRPPSPDRGGSRTAGYLRRVPRAPRRWHDVARASLVPPSGSPRAHRRVLSRSRVGSTRSCSPRASSSWSSGVVGWIIRGGPASVGDLIIVLDLTVGGTVLGTGALVGRARAVEARRGAQLGVLQQAAQRMSASLSIDEIGRAVVEETRRVIDYHNARVYLFEPPDELVPITFEGRVGAYEQVDLAILRAKVGDGFTGWVAEHREPLRVDDAIRRSPGHHHPGHGPGGRVDARGADAARRGPGGRDHAVEARAGPVRLGRPAAAHDPRGPGRNGVHRCPTPGRDGPPRGRAAPARWT